MAATGSQQNVSVLLASYPQGFPVAGKDIVSKTETIDLSTTEAPPNGIFLQNLHFSLDPYQRGRMNDPAKSKSYIGGFQLDTPILNTSVSRVLKSNNASYSEGDVVIVSQNAFKTYSALVEQALGGGNVRKLENPYGLDEKLFLGPLGMPGLTAYSSFYEIGKPKKGETIFISAASGAVGAIVGQLAKREGLRVIGSVGSDDKLKYITDELGFDGGFNYKTEEPAKALERLAPKGVDIYYENVGGVQLEAAIGAMNEFGRIVACGMISQYNLPPGELYGVKNMMLIVGKRIRMQGFIVVDPDFGPKYAKEQQVNLQKWLHEGSVKGMLSVTKGLENTPTAFVGMLKGENFGKAVVSV